MTTTSSGLLLDPSLGADGYLACINSRPSNLRVLLPPKRRNWHHKINYHNAQFYPRKSIRALQNQAFFYRLAALVSHPSKSHDPHRSQSLRFSAKVSISMQMSSAHLPRPDLHTGGSTHILPRTPSRHANSVSTPFSTGSPGNSTIVYHMAKHLQNRLHH